MFSSSYMKVGLAEWAKKIKGLDTKTVYVDNARMDT